MTRKNAAVQADSTPDSTTPAVIAVVPTPSLVTPRIVTNRNGDEYGLAFDVVHIKDGIGTHGTGTNKKLVVTVDDSRRDSVPDSSDGYKLSVLRVYPDDVVGLLNHDSDRVKRVITDLRAQLEAVAEEEVESDLTQSIAYYSGKESYPIDQAFVTVIEFRQQTKRDSSEIQLVAKLGSKIDGKSGVPVFAKKGIPMPNEEGKTVWRLCAIFMSERGNMGVAVALPDKDALKEAIASLTRQSEAIAQMGDSGLGPVNGQAKVIARQVMNGLKRA